MDDKRRRSIAFEKLPKRMLKYPETSDDVKVVVTELQEHMEISEDVGISIRQAVHQAMNENGQKIFEIFRQGKERGMYCHASLARWNAQLKGLLELERRCRNTAQEVQVLSERQQIFKNTMEDKLGLQSRAPGKCHDQIFEEIEGLEEKKSEEVLPIVQKKHDL